MRMTKKRQAMLTSSGRVPKRLSKIAKEESSFAVAIALQAERNFRFNPFSSESAKV
jgi:cytochrome c556